MKDFRPWQERGERAEKEERPLEQATQDKEATEGAPETCSSGDGPETGDKVV